MNTLIFDAGGVLVYPRLGQWHLPYRAAEILGVHKLDLIEFYQSMGIPYLRQSKEELEEEIAAYRAFKENAQ